MPGLERVFILASKICGMAWIAFLLGCSILSHVMLLIHLKQCCQNKSNGNFKRLCLIHVAFTQLRTLWKYDSFHENTHVAFYFSLMLMAVILPLSLFYAEWLSVRKKEQNGSLLCLTQ